MFWRRMTSILVSLVVALTMSNSVFAKKLTIGFAQTGAESDWRTAETISIKTEAKKRGYNLKFADAQGKQENQIKAIRSFIAQGVDGIILAPLVVSGWDRVLKEAKRARIPVVLVDRGIEVKDKSLYVTQISSDFILEGRLAASWLAAETSGIANIVELQGATGADPAILRKKGFAQVVDLFPKMNVIKSQTGEWSTTKGKEVMEAFLKAEGRKIDAVYAHNDNMAIGAIMAIEEYGLRPHKDIKVIGIDAVKAGFELLAEEKMSALVECNPLLGPLAFDAVEKAIRGESMPKWIVQVDQVFTQVGAREILPTRKY